MPGVNITPREKDPFQLNRALRSVTQGKINSTGTFTLTNNATSTTVPCPFCSSGSVVLISPQTADAANDMATTWTVSGSAQFVVNHANNSRSDRTFGYAVLG